MLSICLFCLNTGVTILTSDKTDFISLWSLYSLIFCCTGSWLLHRLFSGCGEWGLLSSCGVQAPHSGGFACCRTVSRLQRLWLLGSGAQSQQLWYMGFVVLQHVGSSRIRDQTHVSCMGRILDKGSSPRPPSVFLTSTVSETPLMFQWRVPIFKVNIGKRAMAPSDLGDLIS